MRDTRWTYYITEVSEHEVSVFGNAGAGYILMYGPFDIRYEYARDDLERWVDGLERWGYKRVEAPSLRVHRKRISKWEQGA